MSTDQSLLISSSRKIFSTLVIQCVLPMLACMQWVMLDSGDENGPYHARHTSAHAYRYDRVPVALNRAVCRSSLHVCGSSRLSRSSFLT